MGFNLNDLIQKHKQNVLVKEQKKTAKSRSRKTRKR